MTYATETGTAPPAAWTVQRIAVSLAFLANGFVIGSWAPQIPIFAARLDLSKPGLGMIIFGFGIGAITAMPLVGRFIAARGSRAALVGLHFMMVPVMLLVASAPSVPALAVAVLYAGIAIGGMDVAMNANAVSLERHLGRAIMSSCHGFWSLGGLAGASLGGLLIASFGALAHGAAVTLLVTLPLAFIARAALSDRVAPGRPAAASDALSRPKGAGRKAYGRAVAIGIFALFAMIPEGAAIDWGALYLRQELGAGIEASGLAFAAVALTMAILRFAGDGVRNRYGAVRTARVCAALAIAGLLIAGLAPNVPVALVGFALLGAGLSNMVPLALSAAGNLADLKPGAGLSTAAAIGYSGILIAPSGLGFIAESTGLGAIFAGLAVLLVCNFFGARLVAGADRPEN